MTVSDDFFSVLSADSRKQGRGVSITTAYVVALTLDGEAIIQFDEDNAPSQKVYRSLKAYAPEVGERVVLVNNVIFGGLK